MPLESGPPGPTDSEPIRVMLVDDSTVIRRVVSSVLADEAGLEVVGTATNGQEALERVEAFRPHVVVLDVEMPVMDGLSTLRALRPRMPALPVIMFSTLTSRCAAATLDALSNGASDYATKPASLGSLDETMGAVRDQLVPLIRSWGAIGRRRLGGPDAPRPRRPAASAAGPVVTSATRPATAGATSAVDIRPRPEPVVRIPPAPRPAGSIEAVVIGSSAGGPNALAELIPQFPGDMPVPMLLTQHMPETFTQLLAARLNDQSELTVLEGAPGMPVEPGHLYIARGGDHLVIVRTGGRLVLDFDHGPPENYCRPAVDVMFRSAARTWGSALLAVVLTGMGRDGVEGARAIVEKGGTVLTQDEETCLVWGMPGAVVEAGLSSESLPLGRIAPAVCQKVIAAGAHPVRAGAR